MQDSKASDNLSDAFAVGCNDALETLHDQWAETRDAENAAVCFRLLVRAAAFFPRCAPINGKRFDAECGTGPVAENLYILCYRNLVAIDLSKVLLEKARPLRGMFLLFVVALHAS